LAGLAKLDPQAALSTQQSPFSQNAGTQLPLDSRQTGGATALPPHRPFKIIYATMYYDVRPTFVVDITEQFEGKFASIMAYKSQFSDQEAGKDLFPAHDEIRKRVEAMARYYGMLGGVTFAEPFCRRKSDWLRIYWRYR